MSEQLHLLDLTREITTKSCYGFILDLFLYCFKKGMGQTSGRDFKMWVFLI